MIVSAGSPDESIKYPVAKRIAILEGTPDDDPLLRTVMDFYSVKPDDLGEAVGAIVRATGKSPGVIDREATEIAVHNPLYEEITIPAGAFPLRKDRAGTDQWRFGHHFP